MEVALDLISKNPVDFRPLITRVVSMEEAPSAFKDLIRGRKGVKTVVRIDEGA